MNLNKIIKETPSEGYDMEYDISSSTIKTRRGDVKVIVNKSKGQPHCFLGKNEIQIFAGNNDPIKDLIHEKNHFKIFPYDLISFGLIYGTVMTYSMYKVAQANNWLSAVLIGTLELFWAAKGGLNLYQEGIIYAREKLGVR